MAEGAHRNVDQAGAQSDQLFENIFDSRPAASVTLPIKIEQRDVRYLEIIQKAPEMVHVSTAQRND